MTRIILPILLLSIQLCFSQSYKYTVGLRGGGTSGITLRYTSENEQTFEGIFSFPHDGFKVTGLKEDFRPVFNDYFNNITFVRGYGLHAGVIHADSYEMFGSEYRWKNHHIGPVAGIDGLLGFEYRFMSFPLIVGFDYKPYFEFSSVQFFHLNPWDFGFCIKYSFN